MMQVDISDETAAAIEQLLRGGEYSNASDVIDEAVRQLTESAFDYPVEVRARILAGIASVQENGGTVLTREVAEAVSRRGRDLLEERRRSTL